MDSAMDQVVDPEGHEIRIKKCITEKIKEY
ncbi:hypothetical protein ES705_14971 [subsurface metagenome]